MVVLFASQYPSKNQGDDRMRERKFEPRGIVELELFGHPVKVDLALQEINRVCRDHGVTLEELI